MDLFHALRARTAAALQKRRVTGDLLGVVRRLGRPAPMDPQIVCLRGTNREIGQQFARAFPLDQTLRTFNRALGVEPPSRVADAFRMLEQSAPEYLEFLRGIADANTRYSFDAVMRTACCSILDTYPEVRSCGALAFLHEGSPVVGQNLDLGMRTAVALVQVVPDAGIPRLGVVNVGYPWLTTIVNAAGLIAAGSSVNVARVHHPSGCLFPQELLFDVLLSRAQSVPDAIAVLKQLPQLGPLNGGVNAVLADATGIIRHVEVAGGDCEVSGDLRFAATTNHFRTASLARLNRHDDWVSTRLHTNSVARYEAAACLPDSTGDLTPERLRMFLRTSGRSGAWLRTAKWPDMGCTTVSYVVNMHRQRLEYWLGSAANTSVEVDVHDTLGRGSSSCA